jgi:hypothetical protein
MPQQEKTGLPTLAAALGKPDECPACGQNWRERSCSHQAMYAEDLSVPTQARIYRQLCALDRAQKKESDAESSG